MTSEEFVAIVVKRDRKRDRTRLLFGLWMVVIGLAMIFRSLVEIIGDSAHPLHFIGVVIAVVVLFVGVRGLLEVSNDHHVFKAFVSVSDQEIRTQLELFLKENRMRAVPISTNTWHAWCTGFDRTEVLLYFGDGSILYSIRSAQSHRIDWPIIRLKRMRQELEERLVILR